VFLPEPIQGVQQITDDEWIEVPATSYIRGRLRAGDLVMEADADADDEDTMTQPVAGREFTAEGAVAPTDTSTPATGVHTSAQPGVTRRRPTGAPKAGE
jgi:hypothetical protein